MAVGLAAILLGYGRPRGWRFSRWAERPRLFAVISILYLPLFPIDLVLSATTEPVAALVRLIVFLMVSEALTGDGSRPHRPVLFGLLLMMSAAAETTDIWFALPLIAFALAAAAAQIRATLLEAQPAGAGGGPGAPARGVLALAAGSLALGTVFFFIIPRLGTGWGRRASAAEETARIETGLAEQVSLNSVGRVKRRNAVAFRARLERSGPWTGIDPETIYWRALTYSHWTGAGWGREEDNAVRILSLPAREEVPFPGAEDLDEPSLIAEIERVHSGDTMLLSPGIPLWLRAPRDAVLVASSDGTFRGARGQAPRIYVVAARIVRPKRDASDALAEPEAPEAVETREARIFRQRFVATGPVEPEVEAWAESVAPGAPPAYDLARAFVRDLSTRRYSLDTTAIDPERPIGSFLAGSPGHCEYFASAMALGLRLRGVPARVVGGYLGADTVPFGEDLIVRETRAHLWVEAFLAGSGWTPFDPTPPEGRYLSTGGLATLRAGLDRATLAWDSWFVGLDFADQMDAILTLRERAAGVLSWLMRSAAALATAVAALLLAVVFLAIRKWRGAATGGVGILPPFYARLLRLTARQGLVPAASETPGEFGGRAAALLGDASAVALISRLYEKARFGGLALSAAELAAASEALARLDRRRGGLSSSSARGRTS